MNDYVSLTLKTVRKTYNLTQEQFASEIGVTPGHIGTLEQGRGRPSHELMEKIIIKYNVDANMFFGRTQKGAMYEREKTLLLVENLLEGVNETIRSYGRESRENLTEIDYASQIEEYIEEE